MDISLFSGPVLVTAFYLFFWYYLLLIYQRSTKYRLQKEYEASDKIFDRYFGQDQEMLAADRAVANTLEQMVPFVVSLWLHAVFVSTVTASWCGFVYVILRACYPLFLGKKLSGLPGKRVYWVTLPCYGIIFYFLGSAVLAVLSQ